ncbi:MAG: hypothetical protein AB1861_29735 [Cyanobacteriota bacterium]
MKKILASLTGTALHRKWLERIPQQLQPEVTDSFDSPQPRLLFSSRTLSSQS